MAVAFADSKTKENLMRAFAGESQARNRYTFAAQEAQKQKLHVVEAVFTFTANQEKEHAQVFYGLLRDEAGKNIEIDGAYPVDISQSISQLLRFAEHNEYEEHDDVYKHFSEMAKEEGFPRISMIFEQIAKVEKMHGERFAQLAELLEQNKLFVSDVETGWMCLNCGYTFTGKGAPEKCPVCEHDKGFFIRLEMAPYTCACSKH